MAQGTTISDNAIIEGLHRHRGLMVPAGAILLILVLLVPLPPMLMDLLLVINITLAAVILVTTIYVTHPLEFSVFPSLLLGTTLFRLVLNVASTRLILTAGDRTNSSNATEAAGKVIETFGNFVAGGSLAVGVIIFVILVVIQFVVITKGATRISEVAARFTLDAMPGKQMAIDADLNAGLINESVARQRRQQITREADFYGAMDGASKFVRGDAIAGIIITIVNILGGLYVGMVEYSWTFKDCLTSFTRLTIGDGLVSQIPAFIISISAGLIVTRSASESNLGEEMLGQLTAKPIALAIAGVFLAVLLVTPLPKAPLLLMGGACGGLAWMMHRAGVKEKAVQTAAARTPPAKKEPEKIETLLTVEPMELEVGYGLVRLVDAASGGDLLDRISLIRRQIAAELGVLVPPIRIRDNMQVSPNEYIIKLRGTQVARGEVFPGQFLAMDGGVAGERIPGRPTTEPAFGLPALWIDADTKPRAELANYTVVEPSSVLATHISEVVKGHAGELLTRQQTHALIENLKAKAAPPGRGGRRGQAGTRPGAEGAAKPAPRAGAGPRPGDDTGNPRRLGWADQGHRRADRVRPQQPGPDHLRPVRRRAQQDPVRHAGPVDGGRDQQPHRADRIQQRPDAAADAGSPHQLSHVQGIEQGAVGWPASGCAVFPAGSGGDASAYRAIDPVGGGAGVQRDRQERGSRVGGDGGVGRPGQASGAAAGSGGSSRVIDSGGKCRMQNEKCKLKNGGRQRRRPPAFAILHFALCILHLPLGANGESEPS